MDTRSEHLTTRRRLLHGLGLLCAAQCFPRGAAGAEAGAGTGIPTLYLIGDSTVNNHTRGQLGWGGAVASFFDPAQIRVENRARAGRSSRTFLTEGLWEPVRRELRMGDFMLIQFGHHDGGAFFGSHAGASLKGGGDETREVTDPVTGEAVIVRTYGWYLRQYVTEARARGATAVVLSPVPRNLWKEGRVVRAGSDYGRWAAEAARAAGGLFLDLHELVAKRYEEAGQSKVASEYFGPTDHTHTTEAGAKLTAECVAAGLRELSGCTLRDYLRPST